MVGSGFGNSTQIFEPRAWTPHMTLLQEKDAEDGDPKLGHTLGGVTPTRGERKRSSVGARDPAAPKHLAEPMHALAPRNRSFCLARIRLHKTQ